jgi:hypothetical protein
MRKKAPVLRSIPSSNRTNVQALPDRQRRGRAIRPGAAKPQGQRRGARLGQTPPRPGRGQGSRPADLSAPMIPLTLRAMSRTNPPHARSSARPVLLLLSVLAVLAMACFPGLAAAQENSGIQYETDVPTVPNNDGSNIPSKKDSGGTKTSDGSDAEANDSNTPGGVGSGDDGESNAGGGTGPNKPSQGSGDGTGQAANGSKPAGDVGSGKKLATAPSPSEQASDDGGSSPLVPILIAVAVLAAISIGAYYYRQRRQGPDSAVAPPAS